VNVTRCTIPDCGFGDTLGRPLPEHYHPTAALGTCVNFVSPEDRPGTFPECTAHDFAPIGADGYCTVARFDRLPDGATLGDAATAAGIVTFDTALPVTWTDAVAAETGTQPAPLGFVWCYDRARMYGAPFPLTPAAAQLLRRYRDAN
jgi:hypothetical protein